MKLSEQDKVKAEMLNKLQTVKTVIESLSEGKTPSEKLLQIAQKDLKELESLVKEL